MSQRSEWYGSDEAVRVADNLLLHQRDGGGWSKNIDMAAPLSERDKARLRKEKPQPGSTIDNGATHTQARFLARVFDAGGQERFKKAFLDGVDYLLEAQYPNGGWPQFYPLRGGYSNHITFNDGAMVGALSVLRDVAESRSPYAFVDEERRRKAAQAVEKGIACILKCQIVHDGVRLAWCAQHDRKTFEPRPARTYELVSVSGGESVGVVQFLMSIEKPGPEIVDAIQAAVAWFDRAKIDGIRVVSVRESGERDRKVVRDPSAPPLWPRFAEIGTNRPIFCSRDGVPRKRLADISHERRNGYSWYSGGAAELLEKDYPAWRRKWDIDKDVLNQ